jgi:alpha-amylase
VITSRYPDLGQFPVRPYEYGVRDFRQGKVIRLWREAEIEGRSISLNKEIRVKRGSPDLEMHYRMTQASGDPREWWLGVEFNFSMLDGNTEACLYYSEDTTLEEGHQRSVGECAHVSQFGIRNKLIVTDISLDFSRRCNVWRFPVESVSQSESGMEREYQSSVVIPHWKFQLSPGEEWEVGITLKFSDLAPGID